jgi:DinB family protein
VTTIAWRLGHLGGVAVGGFANRRFGDGTLTTEQLSFPPDAGKVAGFLGEHYRTWRTGLTGLSPAEWAAPLGPSWGPYAEAYTIDLALHVLDEVVHHGAEVGLLRDLYSHRSALHG